MVQGEEKTIQKSYKGVQGTDRKEVAGGGGGGRGRCQCLWILGDIEKATTEKEDLKFL